MCRRFGVTFPGTSGVSAVAALVFNNKEGLVKKEPRIRPHPFRLELRFNTERLFPIKLQHSAVI